MEYITKVDQLRYMPDSTGAKCNVHVVQEACTVELKARVVRHTRLKWRSCLYIFDIDLLALNSLGSLSRLHLTTPTVEHMFCLEREFLVFLAAFQTRLSLRLAYCCTRTSLLSATEDELQYSCGYESQLRSSCHRVSKGQATMRRLNCSSKLPNKE